MQTMPRKKEEKQIACNLISPPPDYIYIPNKELREFREFNALKKKYP